MSTEQTAGLITHTQNTVPNQSFLLPNIYQINHYN